ncbi:hypothetical protein N9N67_11095, partial [Bacteriovoracaceae bacterium]|nr:hypothetical protein [Bacteriovoracaceae bacterium]
MFAKLLIIFSFAFSTFHLAYGEENFFEYDEKIVNFKLKQARALVEEGKKAKAIKAILQDFRRGHYYPPLLKFLMNLLIQDKKYFLAIKVAHKQLDLLGLEYLQKSHFEELPQHIEKIKKLSESRLNYIRHVAFLALLYYRNNLKKFKDKKVKLGTEKLIIKYGTILTYNKDTSPIGHYLLGEIYRLKKQTILSFGNFLLSYEAFKEYPYLIDEFPSAYNFILLHTGIEDFGRKNYSNSSAKIKKYIQRTRNKAIYSFWKKFLKKNYKHQTRIFGKFNWLGHSNPLFTQSTFLEGDKYYERAYSYDFGFILKKENDLKTDKKNYSFEYLNRSFDSLNSASNDYKFWKFEYEETDLNYEYGQFGYSLQYEGLNTSSIKFSDQTPLRETVRLKLEKTYRKSFISHKFFIPIESSIYFNPLDEIEHDRYVLAGLQYSYIRNERDLLRIPNFSLFYHQFFSQRNNEFQSRYGLDISAPLSKLAFQNTSFNYHHEFVTSGEEFENFSKRTMFLNYQI